MRYEQWIIRQRSERAFLTMREQGVPALVAGALCARGLDTLEKAQSFLSWHPSLLCDPLLMKDMDKAVSRIRQALDQGETIAVFGDYDVDGITSTCLLTHYLRSQGGKVCFYIPNRLNEGYGLNQEAILRLKEEEGATLIVTVDCGITALSETEYARSLGIDLVITDHHECKEELPQAVAVVDPHRKDCDYPFKDLAGVGVALKLVLAMGGAEQSRQLLEEYADLAAVGTVADVMKLLGENRTLVRMGLEKLKDPSRVGLASLMEEAGTNTREITSTTVGYCLAPRINAAGRMGQASMAADLLLTEDPAAANRLARALCDLNRERQGVELEIFNQCVQILDKKRRHDSIVLADEAWHQGVVGIVASRLTERYACPVFMICLQDGKGKGSCRSYGGFNLFQALEQNADLLEGFGGHALAAGFTILEENIPEFARRIDQCVREDTGGEEVLSTLEIDSEIHDMNNLLVESVEQLCLLEPYGVGNPKPVYSLSGVTITCLSDVGGGRHLKLRACRDGRTIDAIFFSATKAQSGLCVGDRADLAFYPQINEFRGSRTVQLHLVDLRPAMMPTYKTEKELYRRLRAGGEFEPEVAAMMIPNRAEFTAVWRYLSARSGRAEDSPNRFARNVAKSAGLQDSPIHIMVCLDVMEECGLLRTRREGPRIRVRTLPSVGKRVNLEDAPLMQKLRRMAGHER